MHREIKLSPPEIAAQDVISVSDALTSGYVVGGPQVTAFEAAISETCGAPYAVAVQSGTAALHLALIAAGIQAGDRVLVPAVSFAATLNAVLYVNAVPVFYDVDPASGQGNLSDLIDGEARARLEGMCASSRAAQPIKAIIVAHLFGGMAERARLASFANELNLTVIEDSAEALGVSHRERRVTEPLPLPPERHLSILSFNANKIVTSGGGGAVLCYSSVVADRVRHLATTAKLGAVTFFHDQLGFNYRLPNMNAALGLSQLDRLEATLSARRANHQRLTALLGGGGRR